ncbi:hypothetical protein ASD02_34435 [Ensifer sp. Root1252]|nr:hypothetical protein ASD02_34435 [Ensifer sp. Root1252]KRC68757.1 hypothetical protein ASE32_35265 [Ensifer sp. Root231]KRC93923.1 hypothetical protein ASE47_34930 [Ensifer sp. Root258]
MILLMLLASLTPCMAIAASTFEEKIKSLSVYYNNKDYENATNSAKELLSIIREAPGSDIDRASANFTLGAMLAKIYREQNFLYNARVLYNFSFENWEKSDRAFTRPADEGFGNELLAGGYAFLKQKIHSFGRKEFERSLIVLEVAYGRNDPRLVKVLLGLSDALHANREVNGAARLKITALQMAKSETPVNLKRVFSITFAIAGLYNSEARYPEAEERYKEALELSEIAYGRDSEFTSTTLRVLGGVQGALGKNAEQERSYLRSLEIAERVFAESDAKLAETLAWVGRLYSGWGKSVESRRLTSRALEIYRRADKRASAGIALIDLASMDIAEKKYDDALSKYNEAIALFKTVETSDYYWIGVAKGGIASILSKKGKQSEAEVIANEGLMITRKGDDRPTIISSLNVLSEIYERQLRFEDVVKSERRKLAIVSNVYGEGSRDAALIYSRLAWINLRMNRLVETFDYLEEVLQIFLAHPNTFQKGSLDPFSGENESTGRAFKEPLEAYIKLAFRKVQETGRPDKLTDRAFLAAQGAVESEAAASIAQMASRYAVNSKDIGSLVRRRQDLVSSWQRQEIELVAAISLGKATEVADLRMRMGSIDATIADIDRRIAAESATFAELTNSRPLTAAEAKELLRPDEALVLFIDTPSFAGLPEETFVFVLTKGHTRFVRLGESADAIARKVKTLRCGLDHTVWDRGQQEAICRDLLGLHKRERAARWLPFDLNTAFALYDLLFNKVERDIAGKRLLVVPSSSLATLPLQVLVTQKAAEAQPNIRGYRKAAWLVRRHATSILPSISSLRAVRATAKRSAASKQFLGFGNPILNGGWAWEKVRAEGKDRCDANPFSLLTSQAMSSVSYLAKMFASRADTNPVSGLPSLPDSADELCAIGRELNASDNDIYLAQNATESALRQLSDSGQLSDYRIVQFATHALVAGADSELEQSLVEPGIVLTPPSVAEKDLNRSSDDGLLTASEIVSLHMNADLVVLSACNTAAGKTKAGAHLSGLARAFFYAGARGILVSNWPVASAAAVKITTRMFASSQKRPALNRADGLSMAMLDLIDNGRPVETHPSYWAPFSLVGDGSP